MRDSEEVCGWTIFAKSERSRRGETFEELLARPRIGERLCARKEHKEGRLQRNRGSGQIAASGAARHALLSQVRGFFATEQPARVVVAARWCVCIGVVASFHDGILGRWLPRWMR